MTFLWYCSHSWDHEKGNMDPWPTRKPKQRGFPSTIVRAIGFEENSGSNMR